MSRRSPAASFADLCAAPRLEDAIARLNEFDLARLIQWLRQQDKGTLRLLVLGLAELEAANRFVTAHVE